ncbi:hypothetical protein ACQ4PT_065051 [Festuca glaucescens]
MELRSGRHLRSSVQLGSLSGGGGADRISALPDDLLLLLLARLGCVATAARTSILARRWRGLWTLLRDISFRGVAFDSIEPALRSVSPSVSLLRISVLCPPKWQPRPQACRVTSLLSAAARLAPEEFVLTLPYESTQYSYGDKLPSFDRATSVVLHSRLILLVMPVNVEFPALETLSLSGCVLDLEALLARCPRLRVLKLELGNIWSPGQDLKIQLASLQELIVDAGQVPMHLVDITTPSLNQLRMSPASHKHVWIK